MQKKSKKIIALLFASILLMVTIFLIFNITIIQTPVTTVDINVIELNSEEAIIEATIEITNPNIFDLVMKNFEMLTTTVDGKTVSKVNLEGDSISSQGNKIFSTVATISFDGEIPEILVTKISSDVGVNFWFIQRTFPFETNLKTSVKNILIDVIAPDVNIQVELGNITVENVGINGVVDVYNPNKFGVFVEDISIDAFNEKGESIGNFDIPGAYIQAKSFTEIEMAGNVLLKALNAEKIIFNASGTVGVMIAGGDKHISFSKEIQIKIPKLEDIISLDVATEAVLRSKIRLSLRGVLMDISLEIINPNKIPLTTKDIVFYVYRVDRTGETLLGECELDDGLIEPEGSIVLPSKIIIPYLKMIFSGRGIVPDELLIKIQAKLSVPGVDQYMFIGVRGYQDLHIFR